MKKSNTVSFAINNGEKEKFHCIILSVLEPVSGKNFKGNSISHSVEPRKD